MILSMCLPAASSTEKCADRKDSGLTEEAPRPLQDPGVPPVRPLQQVPIGSARLGCQVSISQNISEYLRISQNISPRRSFAYCLVFLIYMTGSYKPEQIKECCNANFSHCCVGTMKRWWFIIGVPLAHIVVGLLVLIQARGAHRRALRCCCTRTLVRCPARRPCSQCRLRQDNLPLKNFPGFLFYFNLVAAGVSVYAAYLLRIEQSFDDSVRHRNNVTRFLRCF
eukprot:SAG31_NODE_1405_length_8488_cov_2.786029_3_plen_224_part_00